MVASGAPLWLVLVMTLLINARHVVYGPNIAPYLSNSRWWPVLMHGLTDQIFALAHTRLPQLAEKMEWAGTSVLLFDCLGKLDCGYCSKVLSLGLKLPLVGLYWAK